MNHLKVKSKVKTISVLLLIILNFATQYIFSAPYGANFYDTSEYMMGRVAVGIIFPESDGSIDPNTEDWTQTMKDTVISEIHKGLDWWATQDAHANLSFVYVTTTLTTGYEPISRPTRDESVWINQIMGKMGYTEPNYFDRVRHYCNDIRDTNNADWALVVFVVNSLNDADGKFPDGSTAYAYFGGPFQLMTYDNDGYGISNMDYVCAHETGHIFYATDEYNGRTEYCGYLNVVDNDSVSTCLMKKFSWVLCENSRRQVGWRNTDGDNIFDILDVPPETILYSYTPDPTPDNTPTYNGKVNVSTYPNSNPYGQNNDISINTIISAEYRIDSGGWLSATATDGNFNQSIDSFTFTTSVLSNGQHTFEARAKDSVNNYDLSPARDILTINTSAPAPVLSVSPTSHDFGTTETSYQFMVRNTGGGTLSWNASESLDWLTLNKTSGILLAGSSQNVTATVSRSGKSPGTYNGKISFTSNGGNQDVSVSMTVPQPTPVLSVSPTSHDFGTSETTYQFTIKNTGGGTLSWNASESLDWLSLSKSSGSLSGGNSENITATVSRSGKSPGTYNGKISFTSNGSNQDVSVSMTVPQTVPVLSVSPTSHDFGTSETTYQFTVKNTGGGTLSWSASESLNWLSLNKTSGSLPAGASENVTATVSRSGKSPGTYNGKISFTSNGGNQDVSVSMTVPQTVPVLSVSPTSHDFATTETTYQFTVKNSGGGILSWSARESLDWLSLNKTSGILLAGSSQNIAATVSRTGKSSGTYNGTISFTSNGGNQDVSVSMTVPQSPQNLTLNEDTSIDITLTATDPDNDPLTYAIVAEPTHGTLSGTAPNVTYKPNLNYNGMDSFSFKVNDGKLDSNIATVSLTINPVNDPPVLASIGDKSIDEGSLLKFQVSATDPDGDSLTYSVQGLPDGAIFQNQTFTWTPIASDVGDHWVTFIASDGSLSDSEKIVITVKEDGEITLKISFNTDRVSKIGILYISGETNEGAVIEEVKVLDEHNKILDIDIKDNVSINGERYITGILIVGDIIKKYPLLSGIKIRIMVAKGEKTKEGETGLARIEPYAAGPDRIGVYNNVFNPLKGEKTLIKIDTTEQTHIKIILYDTKGKKIKEIADEEKEPGIHRYYWYGKNDNGNVVGSGLYLVHIEAGDYKKTKKIIVVK